MVGVEEVAKKLALWHTQTFRPILTHDDLDPIMCASGFVPFPSTPPSSTAVEPATTMAWRGYVYQASHTAYRAPARRAEAVGRSQRSSSVIPAMAAAEVEAVARLPYPRIDGLHLLAYKAFLDAVAHHIGAARTAELFHVRAMPLTRSHDRVSDKTFRPMRDCGELDDEISIFVYRDGTLDQVPKIFNSYNKDKENSSDMNNNKSDSIFLVPLKDLFPRGDVH